MKKKLLIGAVGVVAVAGAVTAIAVPFAMRSTLSIQKIRERAIAELKKPERQSIDDQSIYDSIIGVINNAKQAIKKANTQDEVNKILSDEKETVSKIMTEYRAREDAKKKMVPATKVGEFAQAEYATVLLNIQNAGIAIDLADFDDIASVEKVWEANVKKANSDYQKALAREQGAETALANIKKAAIKELPSAATKIGSYAELEYEEIVRAISEATEAIQSALGMGEVEEAKNQGISKINAANATYTSLANIEMNNKLAIEIPAAIKALPKSAIQYSSFGQIAFGKISGVITAAKNAINNAKSVQEVGQLLKTWTAKINEVNNGYTSLVNAINDAIKGLPSIAKRNGLYAIAEFNSLMDMVEAVNDEIEASTTVGGAKEAGARGIVNLKIANKAYADLVAIEEGAKNQKDKLSIAKTSAHIALPSGATQVGAYASYEFKLIAKDIKSANKAIDEATTIEEVERVAETGRKVIEVANKEYTERVTQEKYAGTVGYTQDRVINALPHIATRDGVFAINEYTALEAVIAAAKNEINTLKTPSKIQEAGVRGIANIKAANQEYLRQVVLDKAKKIKEDQIVAAANAVAVAKENAHKRLPAGAAQDGKHASYEFALINKAIVAANAAIDDATTTEEISIVFKIGTQIINQSNKEYTDKVAIMKARDALEEARTTALNTLPKVAARDGLYAIREYNSLVAISEAANEEINSARTIFKVKHASSRGVANINNANRAYLNQVVLDKRRKAREDQVITPEKALASAKVKAIRALPNGINEVKGYAHDMFIAVLDAVTAAKNAINDATSLDELARVSKIGTQIITFQNRAYVDAVATEKADISLAGVILNVRNSLPAIAERDGLYGIKEYNSLVQIVTAANEEINAAKTTKEARLAGTRAVKNIKAANKAYLEQIAVEKSAEIKAARLTDSKEAALEKFTSSVKFNTDSDWASYELHIIHDNVSSVIRAIYDADSKEEVAVVLSDGSKIIKQSIKEYKDQVTYEKMRDVVDKAIVIARKTLPLPNPRVGLYAIKEYNSLIAISKAVEAEMHAATTAEEVRQAAARGGRNIALANTEYRKEVALEGQQQTTKEMLERTKTNAHASLEAQTHITVTDGVASFDEDRAYATYNYDLIIKQFVNANKAIDGAKTESEVASVLADGVKIIEYLEGEYKGLVKSMKSNPLIVAVVQAQKRAKSELPAMVQRDGQYAINEYNSLLEIVKAINEEIIGMTTPATVEQAVARGIVNIEVANKVYTDEVAAEKAVEAEKARLAAEADKLAKYKEYLIGYLPSPLFTSGLPHHSDGELYEAYEFNLINKAIENMRLAIMQALSINECNVVFTLGDKIMHWLSSAYTTHINYLLDHDPVEAAKEKWLSKIVRIPYKGPNNDGFTFDWNEYLSWELITEAANGDVHSAKTLEEVQQAGIRGVTNAQAAVDEYNKEFDIETKAFDARHKANVDAEAAARAAEVKRTHLEDVKTLARKSLPKQIQQDGQLASYEFGLIGKAIQTANKAIDDATTQSEITNVLDSGIKIINLTIQEYRNKVIAIKAETSTDL